MARGVSLVLVFVVGGCRGGKDDDAGTTPEPLGTPSYTLQDRGEGRCVALDADGLALGIDEVRGPFTVAAGAEQVLLGSFGVGETTVGLAFEPSGSVVGYSDGAEGRTAVRYAGTWSAIAELEHDATPVGVGRDGAVVGIGRTNGMATAFRLEGATRVSLPFPTDRPSAGFAAGPDGQVVGNALVDDEHTHAVVARNGALVDLGTLGGDHSTALAINVAGDIVGASFTASGEEHAYRAPASGGALVDLGLPTGATDSDARGIDDAGRIVGNGRTDEGDSWPVVWADTTVDLSPAGFTSTHAAAVTPAGDIVGWGVPVDTSGGALRCLVWTLDGGGR